ncbi:MAG: glutamine--fructose-6-phosphate transaminase (isomerizing), partial [Prevotella sp.]
ISQLEKQGYDHFMMKEIMEQPEALEQCMRGRIRADKKAVIMQVLEDYKDQFLKARHITIIACGTSWHAALIGKQLIDQFCRIPVMVEYASEFRYSNPIIEKGDVVMAISQSGETADTLAAIQLSKEKGAFVFGICNAVSSSIARATDAGCYIHVGPEIGVASTKAFTGQVMVLTLMALKLGRLHETLSQTLYEEIITELTSIPYKIREILKLNDRIEQMMSVYTYANNCIYLGRGFSYPVALEGALKLKEISYIHAEGYPAAEMKHGPIALISENMPVICLAPTSEIYDKVLSNIQEIKARNGRVLAIVNTGDKRLHAVADSVIEIPATHECLSPLLSVIPLQLMAYHIAVKKGLNVDMPRNLAKSVTVE